MAQHPVELILARQLAELLCFPIVLVGPDGTLVFYNEPAEEILGVRFEEAGELDFETWSSQVQAVDDQGRPIAISDRPIPTSLSERHPSHARFSITRADGELREVEVTGIPLLNQSDDFRGSVGIFWEVHP